MDTSVLSEVVTPRPPESGGTEPAPEGSPNPAGQELGLTDAQAKRLDGICGDIRKELDKAEKSLMESRYKVGVLVLGETRRDGPTGGRHCLAYMAEKTGESLEQLRLARHVARVFDDRKWGRYKKLRNNNGRRMTWSVIATICAKSANSSEALNWIDQARKENWTKQDTRVALRDVPDASEADLSDDQEANNLGEKVTNAGKVSSDPDVFPDESPERSHADVLEARWWDLSELIATRCIELKEDNPAPITGKVILLIDGIIKVLEEARDRGVKHGS